MNINNERTYTLSKKSLKTSMFLKMTGLIIFLLWFAVFLFLHFTPFDLPRKVDIALLVCALILFVLFEVIDSIYMKRNCKCPLCGKSWSAMKRVEFREGPFDFINKRSGTYKCYNCNSEIEIK